MYSNLATYCVGELLHTCVFLVVCQCLRILKRSWLHSNTFILVHISRFRSASIFDTSSCTYCSFLYSSKECIYEQSTCPCAPAGNTWCRDSTTSLFPWGGKTLCEELFVLRFLLKFYCWSVRTRKPFLYGSHQRRFHLSPQHTWIPHHKQCKKILFLQLQQT